MQDLEMRAFVVVYHGVLATLAMYGPTWVLVLVWASLMFQIILWVKEERDLDFWHSERGYPAAEGTVDHQSFHATGSEREQQAKATVAGHQFARHSSENSEEETETSDSLDNTVGSFRSPPKASNERDISQEAGNGALDVSGIWEDVIGYGKAAESSDREDDEVAEVEPKAVFVEDADRSSGHCSFSSLEKEHAIHSTLNATQCIPRVPESGHGLQLRAELGRGQHADELRTANPKSGILKFSVDDYSGASAQLLGSVAHSEGDAIRQRSQPHRPFVKQDQ
jgi:hypothetical protein